MKNSITVLPLLLIVFIGCQKNDDQQKLDINDLKGNWRVTSQRSGPDSLNPQGTWSNMNFAKQHADYNLYCINDSRVGQSFISATNCAYENGVGSSVGVFSYDCAKTVYMRDTVWSQLSNFDISFKDANAFEFLEQFDHSKRVNLRNQYCTPVPYLQPYSTKNERTANWLFEEASQIITIDYGASYSPFDGEKINRYKVASFTGKEAVLRLQAAYFSELRINKL